MSTAKLTAKQEAFCQAIADGMTQADAYRQAYSSTKMADKTIWEKASAMMADGKVLARVTELKHALAEKQLWTREKSVNSLIAAYKVAEESSNASGMTGAIKELNAMHGFNEPTKLNVSGNVAHQVTRIIIEAADGDGNDSGS